MIPLVVLALLLSAGLATYEFSGRAHAWVDDHARAMREALAAHRAADAHLDAATTAWMEYAHAMHDALAAQQAADAHRGAAATASDPAVAAQHAGATLIADQVAAQKKAEATQAAQVSAQHASSAEAANQAAAQNTAVMAQTAKTPDQQVAAAGSAAAVVDREAKVKDALAHLGAGQCGVRSYARVTTKVKDALLARLHKKGMTVRGADPIWNIDTHTADVKLRAVWDPRAQVLKLIVTAGADGLSSFLVCPAVWDKIDPVMREVIGPGRGARSSGTVHGGRSRW